MKFWVGVTDSQWFGHLAKLDPKPDEVNFWQPGGRQAFHTIPEGAPFLFKLHSPDNYIVGGGFFVRHSFLPLSLAWEAFEQENGAPDFHTFKKNLLRLRRGDDGGFDPTIGCIILATPFFFRREDWIPVPKDWKRYTVQGKSYETTEEAGKLLWEEVQWRLQSFDIPASQVHEWPGHGTPQWVKPRLGCGFSSMRPVVLLQSGQGSPDRGQQPLRTALGRLTL